MVDPNSVVRISQLPSANSSLSTDLFEIVQNGQSKKIAASILLSGGASGYSGYSGTPGAVGISGFSGINGAFTASGYSGFSGISGYSGFSGLIGISGFSGYSGISGFSGYSGSGISGFSGFSGVSGFSGMNGSASGYSGYSGYSGTNGANGISGYSGISGFSGSGSSITIAANDVAYATSTNVISGSALFTYNNTGTNTGYITIGNTTPSTNIGCGAVLISGGIAIVGNIATASLNPTNAGNALTWNAQGIIVDSGYSASTAGGSGGSGSTPVAVLEYQQPSGTYGGASTGGSYQVYPLNTLESDISSLVSSFSSNQFTLVAGTYSIRADAIIYNGQVTKLNLYNVTDSAVAILGISTYSNDTTEVVASNLAGIVNTDGTKTYELQYRVGSSQATNGLGNPATFGDTEVYGRLVAQKISG